MLLQLLIAICDATIDATATRTAFFVVKAKWANLDWLLASSPFGESYWIVTNQVAGIFNFTVLHSKHSLKTVKRYPKFFLIYRIMRYFSKNLLGTFPRSCPIQKTSRFYYWQMFTYLEVYIVYIYTVIIHLSQRNISYFCLL